MVAYLSQKNKNPSLKRANFANQQRTKHNGYFGGIGLLGQLLAFRQICFDLRREKRSINHRAETLFFKFLQKLFIMSLSYFFKSAFLLILSLSMAVFSCKSNNKTELPTEISAVDSLKQDTATANTDIATQNTENTTAHPALPSTVSGENEPKNDLKDQIKDAIRTPDAQTTKNPAPVNTEKVISTDEIIEKTVGKSGLQLLTENPIMSPYRFQLAHPYNGETFKDANGTATLNFEGKITAQQLPSLGFMIYFYDDERNFDENDYILRKALPIVMLSSGIKDFNINIATNLATGKYFFAIQDGDKRNFVYAGSFFVQ